jgi:hypothetical protein
MALATPVAARHCDRAGPRRRISSCGVRRRFGRRALPRSGYPHDAQGPDRLWARPPWITRGTTIYFFDPSGNRLEAFGGYTAYQMDPDCRAIKWTTDEMGPAVFYYSQELNETFLSVYT